MSFVSMRCGEALEIVRTYADDGKSGLRIEGRDYSLKRLIQRRRGWQGGFSGHSGL